MKKGNFHLAPGTAVDREELRSLVQAHRKASVPKPTANEIAQSLSVLADAAEEIGFPIWAEGIRGIAKRESRPAVLTAEEVVRRLKGPGFMPPSEFETGRQSGRTTWMLAEAIALLERDCPIELTGSDRAHEHNLVMQALHMAEICGAERALMRLKGMRDRGRAWEVGERIGFVDHYRGR